MYIKCYIYTLLYKCNIGKGRYLPKRGGRAEYKAVNLPKDLLDQVDDFIKKNPIYRSRAEFVKSAIKNKIDYDNVYSNISILKPIEYKPVVETKEYKEKKAFENALINKINALENQIIKLNEKINKK